MKQEIKISASLSAGNPARCKFTVNRPLLPGRTVTYSEARQAAESPLALALFEILEVSEVRISGDWVQVTKKDAGNWAPLAKKIGSGIRSALERGANPVAQNAGKELPGPDEIRLKIERLFETEINPAIASHGGFVELLDVKGASVYLQMGGGCQGCGMANVTLRQGIETSIRDAVPEVEEILDSTDHASGANPYYQPSKK
ncbi:MAG: NifU family protein [Elusimicrobia bacterium]|nr:NifU family protein [Elusimicrobiota bacterium]